MTPLFLEIFSIFALVFEKITIFMFLGVFFNNFFKRIEVKNHQCKNKNMDSFGICIEFLTKLRIQIFDFCFPFFFYFRFFSGLKKSNCNFYSKIFNYQKKKKKIRRKSKIGILWFVRNLRQIPKLSLFFFLALIVFDFYSFESTKPHFKGEANVYIYIYIHIYIYICIY